MSVPLFQVHDDEGLLACDLLPQAHIQTVGRGLGPHSHFGNQRGELCTRSHTCINTLEIIHAFPIVVDPSNLCQHWLRLKIREGKETVFMVNLQVAWVFESGPRANVAQLSDGSLLDDSFRSLAVIRDIRVAD